MSWFEDKVPKYILDYVIDVPEVNLESGSLETLPFEIDKKTALFLTLVEEQGNEQPSATECLSS